MGSHGDPNMFLLYGEHWKSIFKWKLISAFSRSDMIITGEAAIIHPYIVKFHYVLQLGQKHPETFWVVLQVAGQVLC
jgi:hypothetical protein